MNSTLLCGSLRGYSQGIISLEFIGRITPWWVRVSLVLRELEVYQFDMLPGIRFSRVSDDK